jgi:hypothetical protein
MDANRVAGFTSQGLAGDILAPMAGFQAQRSIAKVC